MHGRSLLLTGLVALLIPATAQAATLPARVTVGPAQGVTASASGRTLTLGFTGAAAGWGRAHAGRAIEVDCAPTPSTGLQLVEEPAGSADRDGHGKGRVASDGATARLVLDGPAGDACAIDGAPGWALPPADQQAYAALTPAGAAYVDRLGHALRLADVIYAARPHGVYASAADVVALGGGEVVALDDPNGTPPAGKIGYWSKGRAVSLITADGAGQRLSIQDLGGGMLRANAFDGLIGWGPVEGRRKDPTSAAAIFGAGPDEDADGAEPATAADEDEDAPQVEEEDVHAHLSADRVVFRFTGSAAKAYRRYAGHRLRVVCAKVPPRALLGEGMVADRHPVATIVRVPRHGGVIRGDAPAGHRDLCVIETLAGADLVGKMLTAEARRYMMDIFAPLAFALVDDSPLGLAEPGATRYPGVATLVASHPGLVGLASPGQRLKAGDVGVWTDADQQALVVATTADGLRYVVADEGHGMMRTNLYAGLLGMVATAIYGPA
jgi:hypothetical protein